MQINQLKQLLAHVRMMTEEPKVELPRLPHGHVCKACELPIEME